MNKLKNQTLELNWDDSEIDNEDDSILDDVFDINLINEQMPNDFDKNNIKLGIKRKREVFRIN